MRVNIKRNSVGLAKDSILYTLGRGLYSGLNFLLLPLYGRFLQVSEYGVVNLITILSMILTYIFNLGITQGIYGRYFDKDADQELTKSSAFWFAVMINIPLFTVLMILSSIISFALFESREYSYYLRIEFISVFNISLGILLCEFMKISRLPGRLIALNSIQSGAILILTIIFLVHLKMGLKGVFWARIIGTSLFALLGIIYSIQKIKLRFSLEEIKEMLKVGLPFIPTLISFWVIDYIDRYLIQRSLGLDGVGVYSMGYTIGLIVMLPIMGFHSAYPPIVMSIAKNNEKAGKEFISRITVQFTVIVLSISLVLILAVDKLIKIVAPSYINTEMKNIIPFIIFSYYLYGMYRIIAVGLVIQKRTFYHFLSSIVAVFLNILLNLLLLPKLGIIGAAYATVISYLSLLITGYLFSRVFYPVAFQYRKILISILVFISISLFSIYLRGFWDDKLGFFVYAFSLATSYFLLLYLLGVLPRYKLIMDVIRKLLR